MSKFAQMVVQMTSGEGREAGGASDSSPETPRLEPGEGHRERTVLRIFRGIMPDWLVMCFGSTVVFYFVIHSFY